MCEMPEQLTAEDGYKARLIGEFFVDVDIPCECGEGCSMCEGRGYQTYRTPIPWTTIKEIYQAIKKHSVKLQAKWLEQRERSKAP